MSRKTIVLSVLLSAVLAACGQNNADGPFTGKDAGWFHAHPASLKKEMQWCNTHAGFPMTGTCLVALGVSLQQHPIPSVGHLTMGKPLPSYGKK